MTDMLENDRGDDVSMFTFNGDFVINEDTDNAYEVTVVGKTGLAYRGRIEAGGKAQLTGNSGGPPFNVSKAVAIPVETAYDGDPTEGMREVTKLNFGQS